jgi:F-type H+-transporting ATPase subunit delta
MQAASRNALAAVRKNAGTDPAVGTAQVGHELLSVSSLLGREASLRNALTDNGASAQRRAELARALLGDRITPATMSVVAAAVSQRWSRSRDLVEALEELGAESMLAHAEREGRIDSVEEQLFRFGRVLESSADLQIMLSDPGVPDATKSAVVGDLLAGRVEPETAEIVGHVVANPGGVSVAERLDHLVRLAATRREQLLADVRVPVPLTTEQHERLAAALRGVYGQPVTLAVSVDPTIVGGAVVRIGDEIIDGSVASRLAAARRTLTQ